MPGWPGRYVERRRPCFPTHSVRVRMHVFTHPSRWLRLVGIHWAGFRASVSTPVASRMCAPLCLCLVEVHPSPRNRPFYGGHFCCALLHSRERSARHSLAASVPLAGILPVVTPAAAPTCSAKVQPVRTRFLWPRLARAASSTPCCPTVHWLAVCC